MKLHEKGISEHCNKHSKVTIKRTFEVFLQKQIKMEW